MNRRDWSCSESQWRCRQHPHPVLRGETFCVLFASEISSKQSDACVRRCNHASKHLPQHVHFKPSVSLDSLFHQPSLETQDFSSWMARSERSGCRGRRLMTANSRRRCRPNPYLESKRCKPEERLMSQSEGDVLCWVSEARVKSECYHFIAHALKSDSDTLAFWWWEQSNNKKNIHGWWFEELVKTS